MKGRSKKGEFSGSFGCTCWRSQPEPRKDQDEREPLDAVRWMAYVDSRSRDEIIASIKADLLGCG